MIIPKGEQEWEFGKESGRICGCWQVVKLLERKRRGRVVGGYKRMKNGLMRMKTVNYILENKHFLDYSVTGRHQYTFIDFIFD